MKTTKYLKELQKQDKLPELLQKLGLPTKPKKNRVYECRPYLALYAEYLVVDVNEVFKSYSAATHCQYKLNDYMLLDGFSEKNQKGLQTLYNYMKANFNTYTDDCVKYLMEHQEKRFVEIDEKSAKEKTEIDERYSKQKEILKAKTADKINLVLGNK